MRHARCLPRTLILLTPVLGCTATEDLPQQDARIAHAIVQGSEDEGHASVAAIVDEDGDLICSATLIASRVLLTAGHCGVRSDNVERLAVLFGSTVSPPQHSMRIVDAQTHPGFVDGDSSHDMTLVLLEDAAAAPVMAVAASSVDELGIGAVVELVGFGATGIDAGDFGRKRRGQAQVAEVGPAEFRMEPQPALSCVGDSGGAVLVGATSGQQLIGVISRGDSSCAQYSRAARIDVDFASFIEPYLAHTAPGTREAGEGCLYQEHCASGVCVSAIDEPRIRYCSSACESDVDCGQVLRCDQGTCRFRLPTPGAMGSSCSSDAQCVELECTSTGICSQRCVADGGQQCPLGYGCARTTGAEFFCVPVVEQGEDRDTGGCATAAMRSPEGSGKLLITGWLVMMGWHWRRDWRRRRGQFTT